MTVLATTLVPSFSIEPDVSQLLPDDNDVVRLSRLVGEEVGTSRALYLLLEDEAVAEKLPGIVARLGASPHLEKVEATREALFGARTRRLREAPLHHLPQPVLEALAQRMGSEEARREAIDETRLDLARNPFMAPALFADPLRLREVVDEGVLQSLPVRLERDTPYLVLEGGRRALVKVTGTATSSDFDYTAALMEDLSLRIGEVRYQALGAYATAHADAQRIDRDLVKSTLMTALCVGLFLLLSMRRLSLALGVMFPIGLAIYWTLPIAGALLSPLTVLTIGGAAILLGLGVDFTIHYIVVYVEARSGSSHMEAVEATCRNIGRPLFVSMLTTVGAFMTLALADFTALRVFGLLLAGGLLLALVSTFLTLPLLLRAIGAAHRPVARQAVPVWDRAAASWPGAVVAGLLVVAIVAGVALVATRGVSFSGDLSYLRPADDPVALAERSFEEEFGFSTTPAVILVPTTTPLEAVKGGVERLYSSGHITWSTGGHEAHTSARRREAIASFHASTAGWVDAAVADLNTAGLDGESFRGGLDASAARLGGEPKPEVSGPILLKGRDHHLVLAHAPREWLTQDEWKAFDAAARGALGEDILAYHSLTMLEEIHEVLLDDIEAMVYWAGFFIALVLILMTGGLRSAGFAAIPAIGGLGITLGMMALFEVPLNMGNCICVPFLLGMGVDGGVHALHHMKKTRRYELGSCGVAIWRTSATSALAFGVLCFMETPVMVSIGQIGFVGVASSFFCCVLLLPVLYRRLHPGWEDSAAAAPSK